MPEIKIEKNLVQVEKNPEIVNNSEQKIENLESAPEKQVESSAFEKNGEQIDQFLIPSTNTTQTVTTNQDIELKKVERILSQGLENVFLSMDSATQVIFKQKGEQTAKEIHNLFAKGKAKLKKIVQLIVGWLKIIPKVNRHFLEQEAKIKADEILRLYQKK